MPPAVERFVLHWGEMGTRWGVNRSVAQIHALLYLAEKPLTAEEIAETLVLARSNVSTSLKELQGWELIRRVHVMGDRRDYFTAETDLWEMLVRISRGRKEREIDPTLAVLRACTAEARGDDGVPSVARRRLAEMRDFLEALDAWYGEMQRIPQSKLAALMRMGAAVARFAGMGTKRKPARRGGRDTE